MAGTVWSPMTRMQPSEWLLGNGEIVKEPPLEMSSSGRKVRIAGTTTSVYMNDLDNMLAEAVKKLAAEKQTHVWLDITGGIERQYESYATQLHASCKFHMVHDPSNLYASTVMWWRFKDTNSPFEVLLWVQVSPNRSTRAVNGQTVIATLSMPTRSYWGSSINREIVNARNNGMNELVDGLRSLDVDLNYKWQEFLRDNPVSWPVDLLGVRNPAHARSSVSAVLELVRAFDDLSEIQVPDLGDPYNPSYRTLSLYGTNVNAELISDLTEYLDGAPTIEKAAELYEQLLDTLQSVGIQVERKSANDFHAALLAGDKDLLNVQIYNLAEQNLRVDNDHSLSTNLATGTFIVQCSHSEVDKGVVAEKWEEALTMASLTGEEDTLLAYARAYAKEHVKRRTESILQERR